MKIFKLWRKNGGQALSAERRREDGEVQKPAALPAPLPLETSARVAVDKVPDLQATDVCIEEAVFPKVCHSASRLGGDRD